MFYHITEMMVINPSQVISARIDANYFWVVYRMANNDYKIVKCANLEEAKEELEKFKDFTLNINH